MLSIYKSSKSTPFGVPFHSLKKNILGDSYNLSLVIIGDKRSKKLNSQYRGHDKIANVLAFPLDNSEGEIFLNPQQAKRDAPKFGLSFKKMFIFLFIHGMLHLKGMRHGSKMKKIEQKFLSLSDIH